MNEYPTWYLCWEEESEISNYVTPVMYTDCEPGEEQFARGISSSIIFASDAFQKLEKQIWLYFPIVIPSVKMKKLSYMQSR